MFSRLLQASRVEGGRASKPGRNSRRQGRTGAVMEQMEGRTLLSCDHEGGLSIGHGLDDLVIESATAPGSFGYAMATASNRIVVGTPSADRVDVYDQYGNSLAELSGEPEEYFGASVAVLGDGSIAVGAPATNRIYIYSPALSPVGYIERIDLSDFGAAMAAWGGDGLVVKSIPIEPSSSGIYMLELGAFSDDLLTSEPLLEGPMYELSLPVDSGTSGTIEASGSIGLALAAAGDYILVGDTGATVNGEWDIGAAYLYTTGGVHVATFVGSTTAVSYFGGAVALQANGDTVEVLIGAPNDSLGVGAAYRYTATVDPNAASPAWIDQPAMVLTPSTSYESFGSSVAFIGDAVAVGAMTALDDADVSSGAVYVYDGDGNLISRLVRPLTENSPLREGGESFGQTLATFGSALLVAAPVVTIYDGENPMYTGAIYGFTLTTGGQIVLPTASVSGPAQGVRLHEATFVATLDGDDHDCITKAWQVRDPSGTIVAAGEGLAISFTPQVLGAYQVTFTLSHEGVTPVQTTATLNVAAAAVIGGVLAVGGSSGANLINVSSVSGGLSVSVDGQSMTFGAVSQVVIYGGAGVDIITVSSAVTASAIIFGGDGPDLIRGGSGNDIIVGGNGLDVLVGGAGRDLIIGGDGIDLISGNADEDILIAGWTAFDQNAEALQAILAEWVSARTYEQRVNNIRDGSGAATRANGDVFLATDGPNATVWDDGDIDVLSGNAGRDWFLFNRDSGVRDLVTDLSANEFRDDLDFITATD